MKTEMLCLRTSAYMLWVVFNYLILLEILVQIRCCISIFQTLQHCRLWAIPRDRVYHQQSVEDFVYFAWIYWEWAWTAQNFLKDPLVLLSDTVTSCFMGTRREKIMSCFIFLDSQQFIELVSAPNSLWPGTRFLRSYMWVLYTELAEDSILPEQREKISICLIKS